MVGFECLILVPHLQIQVPAIIPGSQQLLTLSPSVEAWRSLEEHSVIILHPLRTLCGRGQPSPSTFQKQKMPEWNISSWETNNKLFNTDKVWNFL